MTFEELLQSFFSPTNPIYISLLIVGVIFGLIYVLNKYMINPSISKYQIEKENAELESAKLMALFAQLNPDPMIRVDAEGLILETNDVAEEIASHQKLKGKKISEVFPFIQFNSGDINAGNRSLVHKINNTYYSIILRSEPTIGITQIYFHDITTLKAYENKLIESGKKLRELSDHLQNVIEMERQDLARGLHDGIGQSLALLRMRIIRINEQDKHDRRTEIRQTVIESLEEIIKELKDISYNLKPRLLEQMGLGYALKYLVDSVSSETAITGEINVIGEEFRLDSKLEIYLYRIAQEAIANILKYSEATNFSIQLLINSRLLRMIISDNGKGFDLEKVSSKENKLSGMGLFNIRERVESFRGQLKIDTSEGSGTMIVIEIPLNNELIWQNQNQFVY